MSGGPPHHPHNRQVPTTNPPWNHLQVPNFFPRQPQVAHMSHEHSLILQPTWHTPTTEPMKIRPHTHMRNEMLKVEPLFPRDLSVDLSLARNGGGQNGELRSSTTPISLSVRDTNKINSLPTGIDIQAVELTKCSSPSGAKSSSHDGPKGQKRSNVRVDSILERLNPTPEKMVSVQEHKVEPGPEKTQAEKLVSVIVQPTGSYDENSNSSGILNVPTSTNVREEDATSTYSNEDSLDSNKSRRKRKPSKTVRSATVPTVEINSRETSPAGPDFKEHKLEENDSKKESASFIGVILEERKEEKKSQLPERRKSVDEVSFPVKTRRNTSSESETIDNIAAMVREGLKESSGENSPLNDSKDSSIVFMNKELDKSEFAVKGQKENEKPPIEAALETAVAPSTVAPAISVSVIKTKDNLGELNLSEALSDSLNNASNRNKTNPHFVEVENKLQEMFAGIEDSSDPLRSESIILEGSKLEDGLSKLEDPIPSTSQETVTSTTEVKSKKTASMSAKKTKRKSTFKKTSEDSSEPAIKKKKISKKSKCGFKERSNLTSNHSKSKKNQKTTSLKAENVIKDVYAYDSGSNASSSRSRGPFIQIRGNRDSPLSVSIVNTPINDEDGEKKPGKTKKFHDDVEYRHKVRSKGLHCSTLSTKYDAQTKDATWICAFCKRGPHASDLSGPTSNGDAVPPGDLFGPYFITDQCAEFERRLEDPYDKQFKSKKVKRALDESQLQLLSKAKKWKRKHSDADKVGSEGVEGCAGVTRTEGGTFEIWAHEDCIVWSPGVYLVGPKIAGLEEAVWTCCNVACKICGLKGANVCCLKRGCLSVAHLCCARLNEWRLLDEDCKAYCPSHAPP